MTEAVQGAAILSDVVGDMPDKETFRVDFFAVERDGAAETGGAGVTSTGAIKVEGMHL